ncbi:hypothetical protein D7316_01171 [Gordonia insulae]|uniref:Uncharacterized protein n=1 Tax=Gordonia insulae TaxID=2420509 RepID=A0A3G8JJ05_9ACTN|nr:hypothetical protein D7316_01171 [Gordonia insulae]
MCAWFHDWFRRLRCAAEAIGTLPLTFLSGKWNITFQMGK